jgi:hypothetical protein
MNEAAAKNGGTADVNALQDLGFMYNRNPSVIVMVPALSSRGLRSGSCTRR